MAQRPIVLLVDDDPMMRDLLASVFDLHGGFRIGGIAADGFEGAMLAADLSPDVVVLDYFMPRWDGEKAAEFIRKSCPASKIVAFSAVLGKPPAWADQFIVKTDISRLVPLCESLCAAA
jgi:DNA-binding NarL/FixJ family response regulator